MPRRPRRTKEATKSTSRGRLSINEQAKWLFWIWFLRRHPDIAAAVLIPEYTLAAHQRLFVKAVFDKNIKTCCLLWARGLGKDFTFGIASSLAAILYPALRVGVVGPQFVHGQKFMELDFVPDILSVSPAIASCIQRTSKSEFIHKTTSYWYIKFKNRSTMTTMATGSGISSGGKNDPKKSRRGFRFHLLLINERKDVPSAAMKVYLPFTNVEHPVFGAKTVHAGTVLYRDDRWTEDVEIFRRESQIDDHIFFSDISVLDIIPDHSGFKTKIDDMVSEVKRGEQSPEEAAAESLNMPIDPSEDLFIPAVLIRRILHCDLLSFCDKPVVVGCDIGRVNEATIVVGKPEGDKLDIIWCYGKSGLSHADYARILVEVVFDRFPKTLSIFLDQGGGGDDIAEWLIHPDILDGRTPITLVDPKQAQMVYGADAPDGKSILYLVKWGDSDLTNGLKLLLNTIRQNRLRMPHVDRLKDIDPEKELWATEMRRLWKQLVSARRVVHPQRGHWAIQMPSTRMGKDILMGLVYAVSAWKTMNCTDVNWQEIDEYVKSVKDSTILMPPSQREKISDPMLDVVDLRLNNLLLS